jgi:hypothetical protein
VEAQRRRPRLAALAAVVAVAVGAAGCGDDGPSREEYARQADRVCAEIDREVRRVGQVRPRNIQEVVQIVNRLQSTVGRGIDRLRRLERPAGEDGETAQRFVGALDQEFRGQLVPAFDSLRASARRRDARGVQRALTRLRRLSSEESERYARQLGARACTATGAGS